MVVCLGTYCILYWVWYMVLYKISCACRRMKKKTLLCSGQSAAALSTKLSVDLRAPHISMQPRILALLALFVPAEALVVTGRMTSVVPSSSLRYVRMESPPPPPSGRLGGTIDQDGKSNVWAVEPTMKVDSTSQSKGLVAFAPVIGIAGLIVLLIPLLPILFAANPDQA